MGPMHLPLVPAKLGRVAATMMLLASVACTGSESTNDPTPAPTSTASPTPDPQAQERFAVAAYCIHAVEAIDSRASDDDSAFEAALANLEADADSLPTDDLRKEARDLARFLDDPKSGPRKNESSAVVEWRLQHTPATCLDVTGRLSVLTGEQLAQLSAPTTRATARWYGRADTGEIALSVSLLAVPDEDCTLHTFPIASGDQSHSGAYRSDCRSWGKKNRHNFVMVDLSTTTIVPPLFQLSDLMALDRKGEVHSAVDVRDEASEPGNFLPDDGSITAGGLSGFAVFDAEELQLRAIAYHDRDVLLIITFDGKERTVPRSSG